MPLEGGPSVNGRAADPVALDAALQAHARALATLNRINVQLAGKLDLQEILQAATDAATELTGAQFGAFFYNRVDERGEAYTLYTLSGAPREAFERFPMPRNTGVFGPTFRGEGVVRSDDITQDPRFGHNAPYHGMPEGHLPVRSYLAVPVVSRSGEVHGGLFLGHEDVGVFTEQAEALAVGVAAQAAVGIDNARLYEAAQREIAERKETEAALRASEEWARRLLLTLPAAVYTTDAQGRITHYNDRAAELWGRRPVIGKDLWCGSWRIFHPDGSPMPHDACPMAVALRERRPVHGEEIIVERPGGARAHVLPAPQPLFDAAGELIGAVNVLVDVTPQKQAGRDRALLAAIVESSADAIVSKTLDGTITSWNAGAERLFEYTAEEAVGMTVRRLIPPERLEEEDHILDRIGRGERVEHFETVRVRKDGRRLHVSLMISPVRDEAGRIVGASKIARDITERKRAEAALHESELRFRALADSAPVLIWVSDTENRGTYFNRRWTEFTGRTAERERGLGWVEGIHPDDRERAVETCRRHFDAREEFRLEFRLRHHDGTYRWVHDYGVPRFTADGAFLGYVGVCFDIHERKRSEYVLADARRRAEEAERQIRSIIDHLPELAWWARPDGRIDFYNRRWFEYTGTTPEEMEDEGWTQLLDPPFLPEVTERWQRSLDTGESFEMEFPLRGADGTYRWFLTRAQPVCDRAGRILRWVGVNIDIHDKRRAETQARFLAQSGALVEQMLDAEALLERLAHLAVPAFADWCAIDMVREDGSIEAAAIAHADPDKVRWGWALREQYPVDPDAPTGAPNVIRTGQAELYPALPAALIETVAETEEERRLIREIGYSSVIVVPIRVGEEVVGAITYANTESGRHFDEADLAAAEEVGRRAGAALEMARLHAAVRENAERLRAVIDTAVDGILTIDERGVVESANPAVERIFGYAPEEVVGQNVRILMPEPYHSEHDGYIARYLRTGERRIIGIGREVEGRRKDGSTFPMELAVSETLLDGRRIFTGLVRDISERKAAERLIRFQAHLLETVEQAVIATDVEGRIVYWNRFAETLYGWTAEEAVGRSILDVTPTEEAYGEAAAIMEELSAGRSWSGEMQLRRRDGTTFPAFVVDSPVYDEAGALVGVVGVSFDLTPQKEAEAALRESEARFRAISELTSDFAYAARLGDDGVFEREWVSGAYRHITGYTPEEVGVREPWRELVHPDDLDIGLRRNEELRAGKPGVSEHRLVTKDGAVRWVRDYARPEFGEDGRVVRVVGAVQDITEQKEAEEALRESERRFRHIAEALPQIVYILPAVRTGDTEYLNPRWYEYTGMPEGTSYADAAPGVVHPDDEPRVRAMWAEASETGALVEMEIRLRRHDGQYRWFLTRLVPVTDAAGRVLRWFGTSTEIHAQKDAEAELAERVAARTAELERSNRELDQFAYVASHDLKAPLRAIDNLAAWIAEDARPVLPAASQEHLDLLQGRVRRMEALLDSLLTYSRAGRHVGLAEPVDTAELVEDVVRLLDPPDTFTVEVDDAMPTLVTYRAPLELVFRNLIGNTVKHGRPAGRVRVAVHEAGEGFLAFSVADDGPGIPAEDLPHVFERFYRVDKGRSREKGGTGLGLSIVKHIVQLHGGRVWAESRPDHGATFYFTLAPRRSDA